VCVCVYVCMYGFCSVWVFVCVVFVMCGCFDNCVGILIICVLVFTVFCFVLLCFCIVSFTYIYSYLLLV
jgi:hypothetical protein